jgi:prolyl-tRNA editing enzyme YbaK/EbsC (Cys-tRNA(Pro) deacylase)
MPASDTDRLREYFDQNEVPYRLIEHRAAGSADEYHEVLGTRYEEQAKALFLRHKGRDGNGFATLALQAQKRADLRRVRSLLGARELRLGTRDQLRETTGCDFGELPPVGRLTAGRSDGHRGAGRGVARLPGDGDDRRTRKADRSIAALKGALRYQPCVGGACLPPRSAGWETSLEDH